MEPASLLCRQYVALEHGTCLHSCRVGDISSRYLLAFMGLDNLFWLLIWYLPRHHDLRSFDVKYWQIQCRATDMSKRSWPLHFSTPPLIICWSWFTSIMSLCLMSTMWEKLWPTFDQGHFLSTSVHYPGSWSRDSLLVTWSLHASMVGSSRSTWGFHHWPPIEWFYGCSTAAHWFARHGLYL